MHLLQGIMEPHLLQGIVEPHLLQGIKEPHLILSDWKYVGARYSDGDYMDPYDKESWELTGAKMIVVDGENIKEDTYYRCIEGEIVEVTEDGEIVEE